MVRRNPNSKTRGGGDGAVGGGREIPGGRSNPGSHDLRWLVSPRVGSVRNGPRVLFRHVSFIAGRGMSSSRREKIRIFTLGVKTSGSFGEGGSSSSDGPGRRAVICGLAAYLGAKFADAIATLQLSQVHFAQLARPVFGHISQICGN